VLLHGWPGDRTDYRKLVPLLADCATILTPDLRGFGDSDKHLVDPERAYSAAGQARGVIALIEEDALNHLVEVYSPPGGFAASLGWYRCSSNPVTAYTAETTPVPADRITVPTTVLWQEFDPIFPRSWSDRLDDFFVDVTLQMLDGVGHYTPLEAPEEFAAAIKKRLGLEA